MIRKLTQEEEYNNAADLSYQVYDSIGETVPS